MKVFLNFWIFLLLSVGSGKSQLFKHEVTCETYTDPLNCNAYYQRCADNVILHKFCPSDTTWNGNRRSCVNESENTERCPIGDSGIENDKLESESSSTEILAARPPGRPPPRPPVRPPVVPPRPPANASVKLEFNQKFHCMIVVIILLKNLYDSK